MPSISTFLAFLIFEYCCGTMILNIQQVQTIALKCGCQSSVSEMLDNGQSVRLLEETMWLLPVLEVRVEVGSSVLCFFILDTYWMKSVFQNFFYTKT